MCEFKTQPLQQMMRMVYPDMYRMDTISDQVPPAFHTPTAADPYD